MHYTHYRVRWSPSEQLFEKEFSSDHYREAGINAEGEKYCRSVGGMPEWDALKLVNKWNRQNAISDFTYWIE